MNAIGKLRADIESAIGKAVETPKDFDHLKTLIQSRAGESLSTSTLKRLWGYLPSKNDPSLHTLNILSHFLGYMSWKQYQETATDNSQESDPVLARHLNVKDELCTGDRLRLTWHPGRICDVKYLGGLRFQVLASENTRIQAGNTFECSLIIENEPLYIDNLQQDGHPPVAYVCGKKTGVRFERL